MISGFHKMAFAACLVAFATPAYAYIDPGTGSALVAALVAAFAAAYAYIKHFWHRFIGLFTSKKGEKESPDNPNSTEER